MIELSTALAAARIKPPSILSLIGDTPLVEVTQFDIGPCRLFLKLENQNPGGSIKDRIASRYELVTLTTIPNSSGPIHDVPRSEIS